jgi:hypothetical protein
MGCYQGAGLQLLACCNSSWERLQGTGKLVV